MGKETEPHDYNAWENTDWRRAAEEGDGGETPIDCPLCYSCNLIADKRRVQHTIGQHKLRYTTIVLFCPCCSFRCEADDIKDYQ
jgi:hypothetical protein